MKTALLMATIGAALALTACGGASVDPPAAAKTMVPTAVSDTPGTVSSAGHGPGTGACTNDCDGSSAGPGPNAGSGSGPGSGYGPGPGPMDGLCGDACVGPAGPDPADIAAILRRALQEEFTAENLDRSVLRALGPETQPFALIAAAEARHAEALGVLFERRGLAAPAWTPVSFPSFTTLTAACAAGAAAERADAAFYSPYLGRDDLPRDVRNVFTNLQAASLQNHLPAFERCQ
jgi:hypothetical protein